jgi:O-antigen ligase
MFILVLGIFFSLSRVTWILALSYLFLGLLYWVFHMKQRRLTYLWVILLVSCGTIGVFHSNLIQNRSEAILSSHSYTARVTYNQQGIELIAQNPWFGAGFGQYIGELRRLFHVEPWQYQPVHNVLIFLTAELGILGLIAILYGLYAILRSMWNTPKNDLKLTIYLCLAALLIISLFDHFPVTIQQGQLMTALILGLALGYSRMPLESST